MDDLLLVLVTETDTAIYAHHMTCICDSNIALATNASLFEESVWALGVRDALVAKGKKFEETWEEDNVVLGHRNRI